MLRLCLLFEEIGFALFHFLKAPCLGKNKLSDVNKTKESGAQNCKYTGVGIQYINHTPLRKWIFLYLGVLRHHRQNACLHLLL